MEDSLPTGTNLRLLLVQCGCPLEHLTSHLSLVEPICRAVRACGMTPLATAGHDFPDAGHSLCLILAESHLALHTYPEHSRSVIVELSVCDHQRSNRDRALRLAHLLVELFRPDRSALEESSMLPSLASDPRDP
jgi:S-adenosylmethionine/arginine decarboxylase-like enzyme